MSQVRVIPHAAALEGEWYICDRSATSHEDYQVIDNTGRCIASFHAYPDKPSLEMALATVRALRRRGVGPEATLTSREIDVVLHALRILRLRDAPPIPFEDGPEPTGEEIDALRKKISLDIPVANDMSREDKGRYTNSYLCPNDTTRWDDDWNCICDGTCPNCAAQVEPFASTDHQSEKEIIYNQAAYNKANVIR